MVYFLYIFLLEKIYFNEDSHLNSGRKKKKRHVAWKFVTPAAVSSFGGAGMNLVTALWKSN